MDKSKTVSVSNLARSVFAKDQKASVAWLASIYKTATMNSDGAFYTNKMSNELKLARANRLDLWACIWNTLPEEIKVELRKIIFANYENPDTWNVAYDFYDNHFFLEKIPACREFFNYLDRIDLIIEKENLSPFEKILRIYDIVKILEYDPNDLLESLDLLPSIISTSKASSLGFNRLFYYILKKYKFNIYIAKIKTENERISYISLVYLKDKKYNLDGIYVFDPSMDSLPKDNYKSDEIRLLNYNYFGLKLVDINNSLYGDTLVGALAILAIEDYSYSKEKRLTNKNQEITREFKELEDTFKMDFETLHNNLSLVSSIPFSTLKECIKNVYGEATTLKDYDKLFDENYRRRKKELFRENIDEMLETMPEMKRNFKEFLF